MNEILFKDRTVEYIKLNKQFVEKFWVILNKKGRESEQRYNSDCEKTVFVRRTLNKWFKGKKIAVILDEPTGFYNHDNKEDVTYKIKRYVNINNIRYILGWGEELNISISKASNLFSKSIKANKYTLMDTEFYPITNKEYSKIASLFTDDRPIKDYKCVGYDKNTVKESKVVLQGRDKSEAIKSYKGELVLVSIDKNNNEV